MSRRVTVPIDMASEQKSLLGIISKRQLIYLIVGGSLVYAYIPIVWAITFPFGALVGIISCAISALPVLVIIGILGFLKKGKYYMYFDRYLITRYNYKKEIGIWRRGRKSTRWMEGLK